MDEEERMRCDQHEFWVFSTALTEGWLMLQCGLCGKFAAVKNPSLAEWEEAFSAPSSPYPWEDESRVSYPLEERESEE